MLDIFNFYMSIVSDLFSKILSKWNLAPGVSYLTFFLAIIFTSFFISLFFKRIRKSFYNSDDSNKKKKGSDS